MFKVPEKYRLQKGYMGSDSSYGNNGVFLIPQLGVTITCIASDGLGWEHVSVSLIDKNGTVKRTPTWESMNRVKDLFWSEDDCVIQYHPPKEDYINNHNYCLHLWRPIGVEIVRPPSILIGKK